MFRKSTRGKIKGSKFYKSVLGLAVGAIFFSGGCLPSRTYIQKDDYVTSEKNAGYVIQGTIKSKDGSLIKGAKICISSPDVIALQEVEGNQRTWLANDLGLHLAPNEGCYKNVILSKYQISKYDYHKKGRSNLEAVIKINDLPWHFFSTHLSYKLSDESHSIVANPEREEQAKEVLDLTKNIPDPVVIMGDFNARPDSKEIQAVTSKFKDAFAEAGVGDGYTFPAWYADSLNKCGILKKRRIDYIFVDPKIEVKSCHIIHRTDSSDHFPLVATIQYEDTTLKLMTYNIRHGEQKSILAILGLKKGKTDLAKIVDTIRNESKTAVSDDDGKWVLKGLSEGTYTINICAEGYENQSVVVSSNEKISVILDPVTNPVE